METTTKASIKDNKFKKHNIYYYCYYYYVLNERERELFYVSRKQKKFITNDYEWW